MSETTSRSVNDSHRDTTHCVNTPDRTFQHCYCHFTALPFVELIGRYMQLKGRGLIAKRRKEWNGFIV